MVVKAVLGIDLGSTSSRAFIWCPSNNNEYYVQNLMRNNLTSTRYDRSDFSSTGYPFDDGKVYLGNDPNPHHQPTSLKFGFYVLANASDELVKQYPLVQPLLERKNDLAFRDRLYQGLEGLLLVLRDHVNKLCKAKRLSISTIGLSVPAQWNLDFERVYQNLVAAVFSHPPSEIYFHTETEALAHYLFKDHIDELQDNGANDALLFLDFGGHNMNGCLFKLVYGDDGAVNFYRAGDSFGAGGGSEQWEYNVGLIGDRYLEQIINSNVPANTRQALRDNFCSQKTTLGPENSRSITLFLGANDNPWKVVLDSHAIDTCFEDALRAPLEVASEQIAQFSEYKCNSRRVIVSGGTSKNETLRSRLRKLCADAALPEPLFAETLQSFQETAKIAKGVAYAAGNRRTVEDFFQSGAAFGLQLKQNSQRWKTNPDGLWDDSAAFLLDGKRQRPYRFSVTGGDEVKIVCDPFWSPKQGTEEEERLQYDKCYDILDVGQPTGGSWLYKLSLSGSGDIMHLLIERSRRWGRTLRYRDTKIFPLQFDRGTNCAHVGVRGHSLEELGLTMEENATGTGNANTSIAGADLPHERDSPLHDEPTDVTEPGALLQSMESQRLSHDTTEDGSVNQEPISQSLSPSVIRPRVKPQASLRRCERVDPYRKRHHVSKEIDHA